jgi:hypothetical protein
MAEWSYMRDVGLKVEHERWGSNLPAVDIDHLVIEYSHCQPKALIEYKYEKVGVLEWKNGGFIALVKLGEMAKLPVFVVKYTKNYDWWIVYGMNALAREVLGQEVVKMQRRQYIKFMYKLRGIEVPGCVWRKLGL